MKKHSLEVSFQKLAEDHGKYRRNRTRHLLYLRRVSSDAKFRAQWSICSTIHFNNIDAWVFHVVVFISQIIPSWLETLTMSTPVREETIYLLKSCSRLEGNESMEKSYTESSRDFDKFKNR